MFLFSQALSPEVEENCRETSLSSLAWVPRGTSTQTLGLLRLSTPQRPEVFKLNRERRGDHRVRSPSDTRVPTQVSRMGATRTRLLWSCLLLLLALLHESGSQDLTCMVSPSNVDWTETFNDTCLNFSGLGLSLPRTQPLQASHLQVLDLSRNGLQGLPGVFFANLGKLQTLIVTHNPLAIVDQSLALRCDLELRADCSCGLASWHDIRWNNCSGEQELLCLHPDTGAPRNLSTFLQASCPLRLAPGIIGALVAGTVFLAMVVSGSVLAWRLRRHQGASIQGLSKDQSSHNVPRQVTDFHPRHSSQPLGPKALDTNSDGSTLDYENVFIGELDEDCPWAAPR
ncbi:leucine-rich repeat-containing protein 25 isoform X1 [Cricetulus griseus]|uniref:leucine-rich repeat-containing protein 25 isoform X1 n=1 Tax=Cricetulus griseus TaxID=10029 RepID=UPI000F73F8D8|nr:leucine-rich repeat-containing protein 25 isoform X1 [Cricetulus griseus]